MAKISIHSGGTDDYLTPRLLVKALGPFDTDPCCPPNMPWRTAKRMYTPAENGLEQPWRGRVWLNPPYSRVGPWAERFFDHDGAGMALISMKSADTAWFHLLIDACHSLLIIKSRIEFCLPDGSPSGGKWLSSGIFAKTVDDHVKLCSVVRRGVLDGVIVRLDEEGVWSA